MKKSILSGLLILGMATTTPTLSINFSHIAKTAKVVLLGSFALGIGGASLITAYEAFDSLKEKSFNFWETVALPGAACGLGYASYYTAKLFLKNLKK